MLILKMQICSNMTDPLKGNLSITHMNFGHHGTLTEHRKLHPTESSSAERHKMYILQTSACYFSLPCVLQTTTTQYFATTCHRISDKPTYTTSPEYTSCNPSHNSLHKKILGLFKAKLEKLYCICILLNHLASVKLFFLWSYLSFMFLMKFLSIVHL